MMLNYSTTYNIIKLPRFHEKFWHLGWLTVFQFFPDLFACRELVHLLYKAFTSNYSSMIRNQRLSLHYDVLMHKWNRVNYLRYNLDWKLFISYVVNSMKWSLRKRPAIQAVPEDLSPGNLMQISRRHIDLLANLIVQGMLWIQKCRWSWVEFQFGDGCNLYEHCYISKTWIQQPVAVSEIPDIT